MAGFFKKLIDQVKKEFPNVGELVDSVREGKIKQYFQDQVAEITGIGTPSGQKSYGEYLIEEQNEKQAKAARRAEQLKTVYRDPADVEMVAETRCQINERIKENLNPRNFLWGPKETLEELAAYIVDNSEKELDELGAYIESKGVRYDREAMEEELNHLYGKCAIQFFRRSEIEEYIYLDRMTSDDILQLLDDDLREMEEARNRQY